MSESEPNRRRILFKGATRVNAQSEFLVLPFPDRRTIHWVPPDLAMTEGFSILITSEVLLHTNRHVTRTLKHELGGFLLGNRCRCPNTGREYITIDQYVEAEFTKSTEVSLTFTHESWAQLDESLSGKFYGKKLLGWYHSHPTMSIFLSDTDLHLHRERFHDPWMVALVLEPEKHIGGFFVWNNGKIDPNRYVNFYELLDGESRESVVAWKNYQGIDPVHSAPPVLSANNTWSLSEQPRTPADVAPAPDAAPELSATSSDESSEEPQWGKVATVAVMCMLLGAAIYYFAVNGPKGNLIARLFRTPRPAPTREQETPPPPPPASTATPVASPTSTPAASPTSTPAATPTPSRSPSAKPTPTPRRGTHGGHGNPRANNNSASRNAAISTPGEDPQGGEKPLTEAQIKAKITEYENEQDIIGNDKDREWKRLQRLKEGLREQLKKMPNQ